MKKRVVQALIASIVMSSLLVTPIFAAPQDKVDQLEAQKSETEAQAAGVREELTALLVDYQALQQDMANQEVRITEVNQELETAQAEEARQYEDMKLRIKYMYEVGDTSFVEAIVSARSFAELVNKSEYVQKVHNYDRTKLQEYVETKEQVSALKDDLESQQAEMTDMALEMDAQQANLQSTLDVMRSQIADFDTQLESAKAEAEAELARAEAEVARVVAQQQSTQSGTAAQAGSGQQTGGGQSANTSGTGNTVAANNQQASAEKPAEQPAPAQQTESKPAPEQQAESKPAPTPAPAASSSSGTASKPSNASRGQQIADRGCNYIGNPYVYSGNSLTNGIDCSGFVQQIHAQFGISTPRTSGAIRSGGKAVSYSEMLPGDVICYSGHVAIYIGNNTVVHASNSAPYPKGGIKTTSPANYKTVLAVRRYW